MAPVDELSLAEGRSRHGRASRPSTSCGCWRWWPPRVVCRWTLRGAECRPGRKAVLYGTAEPVHISYRNRFGRERSYWMRCQGVIPFLERRIAEADSPYGRQRYEGHLSGLILTRRPPTGSSTSARRAAPSAAMSSRKAHPKTSPP
ncbi:hypothetical protein [Streptomyces sp. NPDC047028]|uniref:hypothetical protein n=1 Tax=Streptomyces sp. NPDC047028 TaxID=3155793 RepID=UPI0033CFC726